MLTGCASEDVKLPSAEPTSATVTDVESTPNDMIWVSQIYEGEEGLQCTDTRSKRPDGELILANSGIEVFDSWYEALAVCAACECSAYKDIHTALISKVDMPTAVDLGYTSSLSMYVEKSSQAVWHGPPLHAELNYNMRYRLTYELSSWLLVPNENVSSDDLGYYNLVHHANPQCRIIPNAGIDVDPDLRVEEEKVNVREYNSYLAQQVFDPDGDLLNVNYFLVQKVDPSPTCFLVNNADQCLQLAEPVLMSIELDFD